MYVVLEFCWTFEGIRLWFLVYIFLWTLSFIFFDYYCFYVHYLYAWLSATAALSYFSDGYVYSSLLLCSYLFTSVYLSVCCYVLSMYTLLYCYVSPVRTYLLPSTYLNVVMCFVYTSLLLCLFSHCYSARLPSLWGSVPACSWHTALSWFMLITALITTLGIIT